MILLDTGPLVALCEPRDALNRAALRDLDRASRELLILCAPVLTEAFFLLPHPVQRRRLRRMLDELSVRTGGRGPDACIDAVGMEAHGDTLVSRMDRLKQQVMLESDRPHVLRQAIQGEVRFAGNYPITRGEHLSDVLMRAGGLTSGLRTISGSSSHPPTNSCLTTRPNVAEATGLSRS